MLKTLKRKIDTLCLVEHFELRAIDVRIKDLAILQDVAYQTMWNRLNELQKSGLITSTTRPKLTARGNDLLQSNTKCSIPPATTYATTVSTESSTHPSKYSMITLGATLGITLTLLLQELI